MKKSLLATLFTLAPAVLVAQTASTTTSTSAEASARAGRTSVNGSANASSTTTADIPSSYSSEGKASLNATFAAARSRDLPEQPIRDRIAEGRAKGASEGQVILAARRTEARLEASQSAMLRAGRKPTRDEVARGEHAMVRGATEAQIEVIARRTPPERSMTVALDVLAQLQASGMTADHAVAQIVAKLDARASDQAIGALATSATVNANAAGSVATPAVGASTSAAAGAAGSVSGAGAGVAGGAVAGVGGVIKPPVR